MVELKQNGKPNYTQPIGSYEELIANPTVATELNGNTQYERLVGSNKADTILGGAYHHMDLGTTQSSTVKGDQIFAGDGNDTIKADAFPNGFAPKGDFKNPNGTLVAKNMPLGDNDYIQGGKSADDIDGGSGNDTIFSSTEFPNHQFSYKSVVGPEATDNSADKISAGLGNDKVFPDGNDTIYLGEGNDSASVKTTDKNMQANTVYGGVGDDDIDLGLAGGVAVGDGPNKEGGTVPPDEYIPFYAPQGNNVETTAGKAATLYGGNRTNSDSELGVSEPNKLTKANIKIPTDVLFNLQEIKITPLRYDDYSGGVNAKIEFISQPGSSTANPEPIYVKDINQIISFNSTSQPDDFKNISPIDLRDLQPLTINPNEIVR